VRLVLGQPAGENGQDELKRVKRYRVNVGT
jgi:hypothetical protein